ncbi:MAG: TIGR03032 family protein [Parvularculaceae bacterium]|nr:MAG: TIGR03032 family protein [Parvularculaceae bacterium]
MLNTSINNGSYAPETTYEIYFSNGLTDWFLENNLSVALSTYQAGKIIFLGAKPNGERWIHNRSVGVCKGMALDAAGFWVATDEQLIRFGDLLSDVGPDNESDAIFAPRKSFYTGNLDGHDVALLGDKDPVFVNTLFNCLSRPSSDYSFEPYWKPKFITELVAEDRCHLNGLAVKDGAPAYVTSIAQTNSLDAWRGKRDDGGVVIDVNTDEVVCENLSMPHSPRWHNGALWVHNSGRGEFGKIDLKSGNFQPITFCPGYLRGMAFFGDIAIVGLSIPRNKTFGGLKLQSSLENYKLEAQCGIYFIDTVAGEVIHSVIFDGVVKELYDVLLLSEMTHPSMISPLANEDVRRTLSVQPVTS